MMRSQSVLVFYVYGAVLCLVALGCGGGGSSRKATNGPPPIETRFDPANFDPGHVVDHPGFPLIPGTGASFTAEVEGGTEVTEIFVSYERREIAEVECTIVVDRCFLNGQLVEETFDLYAQDLDGNVWYLGEDGTQFTDGQPPNNGGSWQAGKDGARPGLQMKAHPRVGDVYQQEFAPGISENMARVVGLDMPVTLSDGSSYRCLQIMESSPLEPGQTELKYYARAVGLVLEETLHGLVQRTESSGTLKVRRDAA